MKFKDGPSGRMANEWKDRLHPDVRTVLLELEYYSEKQSIPLPVVTMLGRSRSEQVEIYTRYWRKLLLALEVGPRHFLIDPEGDGTFRPLSSGELGQAQGLRHHFDFESHKAERADALLAGPDARAKLEAQLLERLAEGRFTWHWCFCAADLRSNHYSGEQHRAVVDFLDHRCRKPLWEFLVHDVTAPHIHIARRDFSWRAKGTAKETS